jgi:hypothetical protein
MCKQNAFGYFSTIDLTTIELLKQISSGIPYKLIPGIAIQLHQYFKHLSDIPYQRFSCRRIFPEARFPLAKYDRNFQSCPAGSGIGVFSAALRNW